MTALAQKHGALNLAQGLMWLDPDPALLQIAGQLSQEPTAQQYTSPAGDLSLRQTVAQLSSAYFQTPYDPENEITITTGATEGLFAAILALTQPGDSALFVEPAYDSYFPAFALGGVKATSIPIPLHPEGIAFPWEAVEARLSPAVRLLLLNFPHNPTGLCLDAEGLTRLEDWALRFPNLLFVVDEAYELMTWHPDPERMESLPPLSVRQSPILRERSVVVGSLGKMVGATGWRLGYVAAPPPLTEAIRSVHQFITFCAASPLQRSVAAYLGSGVERALYFHAALLERRRFFLAALRTETSLQVLSPAGGYFVLIRVPLTLPDIPLAEYLTREVGVAPIPLSPFYQKGTDPGWLRLCFARPLDMLKEAVERLSRAFPPEGQSNAHLSG